MSTIKKLVITVIIFIVLSIAFRSLGHLVTTDISIQSQLADSDSAAAGYSFYQQLLHYSPLVYPIIALLMFQRELKSIFKKR